jgi:UPF0271 protein
MTNQVDINCDMGEGIGNESEIMPYITSANIACGFHGGDKETIRQTIALCLQYGVKVGAHPSYPDRKNFGRVDMVGNGLRPEDISGIVTEQLQLMQELCREQGATLHHVKPHGALYNRAASDATVAAYICHAINNVDCSLLLYGLSGSIMADAAAGNKLSFRHEVFSDRTYQDDGSLTPRSLPNALIHDEAGCISQVKQMLLNHSVTTVSGKTIPLKADTICIHGDGKQAVSFAKAVHQLIRSLKRSDQIR